MGPWVRFRRSLALATAPKVMEIVLVLFEHQCFESRCTCFAQCLTGIDYSTFIHMGDGLCSFA
jgi:hypothetical protein